jgi:hypothetical protein
MQLCSGWISFSVTKALMQDRCHARASKAAVMSVTSGMNVRNKLVKVDLFHQLSFSFIFFF